jgi:hypothetical protein
MPLSVSRDLQGMNQDYVNRALMAYELADAQEQLNEIVERFTPDAEINESDLRVWFAHLYGHLNSAWNTRHCSQQDQDLADGKQLDKWKQFPTDIDPI